MSKKPTVGEPAPPFTAPVVGGEYGDDATLSLADLAGETVVLYFYPRDNTPGCTIQACGLRDNWEAVSAKAKVFGVSTDSIESHKAFIERKKLPFPLISDTEKVVVRAYGVWSDKSLLGRLGLGTERATFIIAPDQTIKAAFPKVGPVGHVAKILAAIEA